LPDEDPLAGVAVFVAAARAGGFALAARRLGTTRSAVGKAIARLEARLGVALFRRTTRATRLTAEGESYLAACAAAMDGIEAAQAAFRPGRRGLVGPIHISMPVAFGRRVLLPILTEIARPHPGLRLNLTFTDATSDLLRDEVDLAIRFGTLADSSHLVARHLASQDRVICAAPAYLRAHGAPRGLAELRGHRCIVGSAKGPPTAWVVREGAAERRITPPATHRLSDGEAIVDAAAAGLGLCQMPASLVRDRLSAGTLEAVLRDVSTVPVEIHAVRHREAVPGPRVRHVVDQLVAYAARGRLS